MGKGLPESSTNFPQAEKAPKALLELAGVPHPKTC
jgi:hypothetical protein